MSLVERWRRLRLREAFQRLSIEAKLALVVTATTLGGLVVATVSFVIYDGISSRAEFENEVAVLGRIAADRATAAVAFGDTRSAEETLQALGVRSSVLAARLLDEAGEPLAAYTAEGAAPRLHDLDKRDLPPEAITYREDRVYLSRPIVLEGVEIGTLLLESDLAPLRERRGRYTAIASAVALLSFVLVFLLSSRLRRSLAEPVTSLARTARGVTRDFDYSVRVPKTTGDEIGDLVDAFNGMLEEIANRDKDLVSAKERAEESARHARSRFEETRRSKDALEQEIAERERLERQIRQSQKMEAIGRLAGGVAHDFNNMLMVILGGSEAIRERPGDAEQTLMEVDEIAAAAERAASVTRQLLAFSRQQVLSVQELDLNRIVTDTRKMLERLIGEDVELSTHLHDAKLSISVDPGQIQQVLLNLVVNARDAMPAGGALHIATDEVEITPGLAASLEVEPGRYCLLEVRDTGEGMPPEVASRIFEPFFTTKGVGQGTGLGLATVYGIVRQSGGAVSVESDLGAGTQFRVYLPNRAQEAGAGEGTERREVPRGNETLLLVEDDGAVRRHLRSMLERSGYQVLEAVDGVEALEVSRAFPEPFDMVVTDVVMPRMSARELVERLEEERGAMRVLFVSGYVDDVLSRHGVTTETGRSLLQKPFTRDQLAERVRALLDGPPPGGSTGSGSASGD